MLNLITWNYYLEYFNILILLIIGIVLGLILILLSVIFATDKGDVEKLSAFECGFGRLLHSVTKSVQPLAAWSEWSGAWRRNQRSSASHWAQSCPTAGAVDHRADFDERSSESCMDRRNDQHRSSPCRRPIRDSR